MLSAGGTAGDPACTYAAENIGQDKCTMELDFTCPTSDAAGTERWVGSHRHVAAGRVEGSMTLQLQHTRLGSCRSTCAMTMQRQ